jgi:soluble lytic murein transglycosylase
MLRPLLLRALPQIFSLALIASNVIAQTQLSPHDDVFISLRDAASKQRVEQVDKLAAQLPRDYPLHAFAEYWKLKVRQPDVGDAQMVQFIQRYEGHFVADRLRNDWLLMLGKRGDWKTFDAQQPLFALADDAQVDCYAVASKAAQGYSVKAEARAVALRNPAHLAGEGCTALVEMMHKTQQFQTADVWDAIQVLAEGKRTHAALRLTSLLNVSATAVEQAINTPSKTLLQRHSDKHLHQLALAAQARGGFWGNEVVTAHAAVQGASSCAQRLGNDCNSWFKPGGTSVKLPDALDGLGSDNTLEWSLRGALRAQDWPLIAQLTQRLPPHLRKDPTWTYWQAKALTMTGQAEGAKALYDSIASGYGFYGLLAREAVGQSLPVLPTLMPPTDKPDDAAVKAIMAKDEVQRMLTFFKLGLRWEGNREWNWMIRGQSDAQLLNYAEAGRRLGHLDRMINSADRTKVQIDFKQRFPMPYIAQAQPIADGLNLDTNWVYGLMRQESRFISDVRSSVSARGLMQIMPATAAFVAKKINLPNYTLERLIEPDVNLTLGHSYLSMVLGDLDNLPILATAAYNAGPGRAKNWRASLAQTVDGAIFAETIPFNETRGYVKQVFANAVLYGVVTGNKPRPLSQWLGTVTPKGMTPTTLP